MPPSISIIRYLSLTASATCTGAATFPPPLYCRRSLVNIPIVLFLLSQCDLIIWQTDGSTHVTFRSAVPAFKRSATPTTSLLSFCQLRTTNHRFQPFLVGRVALVIKCWKSIFTDMLLLLQQYPLLFQPRLRRFPLLVHLAKPFL